MTKKLLLIAFIVLFGAVSTANAKECQSTNKVNYYTIKKGESLNSIANKPCCKTTWKKIYNANKDKIKNPNLVHPGQKVLLPNCNCSDNGFYNKLGHKKDVKKGCYYPKNEYCFN